MKKFIINEDQLKALISYLMSRPYSEVAQGVSALQSLEELSPKIEE